MHIKKKMILLNLNSRFDYVFCTRGGNDTYRSCLAVCRSGGAVVTIVTPVMRNLDRFGFIIGSVVNLVDKIKIKIPQVQRKKPPNH